MKKVWVWIGVTVVIVAALAAVSRHDWQNQSVATDPTGIRTQQQAGTSEAGKHDTARGKSAAERFDEVAGSARPLQLSLQQRAELRQQLAGRAEARVDALDTSIVVGASVPDQVVLHDLPVRVADTLGGYHGGQFVILRDQLIVVDEARRIVAIIPDAV